MVYFFMNLSRSSYRYFPPTNFTSLSKVVGVTNKESNKKCFVVKKNIIDLVKRCFKKPWTKAKAIHRRLKKT